MESSARSAMTKGAVAVALAAAALIAIVSFAGDWRLADLLQDRDRWVGWYQRNQAITLAGFAAVYVAVTALSIPGAVLLTLLAGAAFGLWAGVAVVAASSVTGATLAMLIARYVLRARLERRYDGVMTRFRRGVEEDGARYLFGLRLVPAVPFFLVNLVMGLTRMPVRTFVWVSALGMLPGTIVYVNAGAQVGAVDTPEDLFDWRLILAFLALAILPFAAKWGLAFQRKRAFARRWNRPAHFDFNLVVIGAGSAGLVSAVVAATARAKVALIEQHEMGGDCLNTGCVPSKALLRAAKLAKEGREAERYGLSGTLEPRFGDVMARMRAVIAQIAPHDSVERFEGLGVDVYRGKASITGPWTVAVGERVLTTAKILVATGAAPVLPPIPGLAAVSPLTSETVWGLDVLPRRLLVLGGGAIGCELAQAFARLGSEVVIVEQASRLLFREDEEASNLVLKALTEDAIRCVLGTAIKRFEGNVAILAGGERIAFDRVLVSTGRKPRLEGFGLEELGLLDQGRLVLDEELRSRIPTIYAAGDVVGGLQFTHAASQYAWFASMNALFGHLKSWSARFDAFPIVVYTDPEVARAGLTEAEARERRIPFDVTRYDLAALDRAIIEGATAGFVKVLTVPGKDRILGVSICGSQAGEMLAEFVLAMRHGLGLNAILATVHPYPGWSDANRALAGQWKKAHAPAWALSLSERLLRWQRGR